MLTRTVTQDRRSSSVLYALFGDGSCQLRPVITEGGISMRPSQGPRTAHGAFAAQPPEDRFWAKVRKAEGCWEWTGSCDTQGYGRFFPKHGQKIPAHRYSWILHFGPIPDGLDVCHHCDNPPCSRPDHLFLGTHLENMADMVRKGRSHRSPVLAVCRNGHDRTGANVIRLRDGRKSLCLNCVKDRRERWKLRRREIAANGEPPSEV